MEYFFDTDDLLKRKDYAVFLKTLIDNCDQYHRDEEGGAYVIAVDSAWGSGKSRFLSMFKNYLNGYTASGISHKEFKKNTNVIMYNAWENDYWTDAMEPLMHSIICSDIFKGQRKSEKNENLKKDLTSAGLAVLKTAGLSIARKYLGDELIGLVQNALENGGQAISESQNDRKNLLEAFNEKRSAYLEFKDVLRKLLSETKKKLVILVDELDRCRPTFAIQTLELAKHLFDVKGVVFVFAVDIEQLSHSVKTIYGQGMDAEGYLCRFFNFVGRIPIPNTEDFINSLLNRESFRDRANYDASQIVLRIEAICSMFKLSLRDISTLIQHYYIMHATFLKRYTTEAHELYFFILVLKYKDPKAYNAIFTGSANFDTNAFVAKYRTKSAQTLITHANETNKIKDCSFYFFSDEDARQPDERIIICSIDTIQRRFIYVPARKEEEYVHQMYKTYGQHCSWDKILFLQDIEKWDQIKDMRLFEYVFNQIEMIGFALTLQPSEPIGGKWE